jgi:hypothetical protein
MKKSKNMNETKAIQNLNIKNTNVRLIVRNAKTGALIPEECQEVHNIVTDTYTYLICEAIKTAQYITLTHCSVGSNNLPAQRDQTDLFLPINPRQPISDVVRIGNQIIFSTYYASTSNNGTWRESGLFTSLTAGTMACRALFSSPFEKNIDKTATVEWTFILFN